MQRLHHILQQVPSGVFWVEVAEKSDEHVAVLSVVEDVMLHDLGVILKAGVFGMCHGLHVLKNLFVCLNSIVQPVVGADIQMMKELLRLGMRSM